MAMLLKEKVALISGAGRGIGREIAIEFAKAGAEVAVASRSTVEIEQTASVIKGMGQSVFPLKTDISKEEDVRQLIDKVVKTFGKLDILVNNAGTIGPIGRLENSETASWIETVSINLVGTYFCCKFALPIMIQQHAGKIVNLSGAGAPGPYPMFSAYAASKAGVLGLTQTLAEEVSEFNVQVNAIAPGLVSTHLQDEILSAGEKAGRKALTRAKEAKEGRGNPVGEVASLAVFLASDESGQLTGRLLSAVWDDWRSLRDPELLNRLIRSELYTIRRIDGVYFAPQPRTGEGS